MRLGVEIFVLVLVCIGVTFSSPVNVSVPDAGPGEKPPVVEPVTPIDVTKVKILPTTVNTTQTTQPPPVISTSASSNVTNKDVPVVPEKPISPPVVDNKTQVDVKNMTGNSTDATKPEVNPQSNSTTTSPTTVTNKTTTVKPTQSPVLTTTSSTTQKPTSTTSVTVTTPAPINAQTTVAEHVKPASEPQGRQFDGPSFIGGIVLTIGLTAIGFIAFKFYKSGKVERDYRTL